MKYTFQVQLHLPGGSIFAFPETANKRGEQHKAEEIAAALDAKSSAQVVLVEISRWLKNPCHPFEAHRDPRRSSREIWVSPTRS